MGRAELDYMSSDHIANFRENNRAHTGCHPAIESGSLKLCRGGWQLVVLAAMRLGKLEGSMRYETIVTLLTLSLILTAKAVAADLHPQVVIAAIIPFTGPASYVGDEVRNGMALANEQQSVELVFEDSHSSPKEAVTAFNQLMMSKKPDLVVTSLSTVAMSLAPLAERARTPLMGLVVTQPKFAEQNPWTFNYSPSAADEVSPLIPAIRKAVSRLGVIYLNDDFGNTVLDELRSRIESTGIQIVAEPFLPATSDFRDLLLRLKKAGIDGLYAAGFDSHLRLIVRQRGEIGLGGTIFSSSTMGIPDFRRDMGPFLEGAVFPASQIYDPSDAVATAFAKRYQERFGKQPSQYAAAAYDCLGLIMKATAGRRSGLDIASSLTSTTDFKGVLGPAMSRGGGRQFIFPLKAAAVRSGRISFLKDGA